ncbi:MAG: tRNA (uridine(34)/cytosine(34)/5-carboxymethylaminomethyluridine(34)-2'-O)-methyltransferase TrmL [Clostridiales bacterium]|nr:tRNA (uridine(34)/cytosine(34)/5-carboxymethylaminomethyluridine(34)-2'-O)-methyltransferase TrmL [Clostridiales bacterium]
MIHIVLVSPEIPQNTGNIARTCAATGCALHLVKPLGFSIDDKHLKRAGLDYWDKVTVGVYESFEELEQKYPDAHFYPVETEGSRFHTEVTYPEDVFFVFGKETKGLPKAIVEKYADTLIRLPMRKGLRSLNLSNAAAVMVYEALRQRGFEGLV